MMQPTLDYATQDIGPAELTIPSEHKVGDSLFDPKILEASLRDPSRRLALENNLDNVLGDVPPEQRQIIQALIRESDPATLIKILSSGKFPGIAREVREMPGYHTLRIGNVLKSRAGKEALLKAKAALSKGVSPGKGQLVVSHLISSNSSQWNVEMSSDSPDFATNNIEERVHILRYALDVALNGTNYYLDSVDASLHDEEGEAGIMKASLTVPNGDRFKRDVKIASIVHFARGCRDALEKALGPDVKIIIPSIDK